MQSTLDPASALGPMARLRPSNPSPAQNMQNFRRQKPPNFPLLALWDDVGTVALFNEDKPRV